jgi:hypothetical protein
MRQDLFERRKGELRRLTTPQLLWLLRSEGFAAEDTGLVAALLQERFLEGTPAEVQAALAAAGEKGGLVERDNRGLPGSPQEPASAPPSLARDAEAAFRQDLPRLLAERPGQWVAYHGARLLGYARTDLELYRLCEERGIPDGEYIVRPIEEDPPDTILLTDWPIP